ncbi:hypothetical protein [Pseudomonas sp. NBRC 111142]|uniref:hypothetical protein n=1 Tax=Pseudomonas sp. NBRC 111142 TaxID=1661057 RepID=UPI002108FD32|nr:hypothetical protein [Pseudomonas sp. NBRC 111142]
MLQPEIQVALAVAIPVADLRLLQIVGQQRQHLLERFDQFLRLDQVSITGFERRLDGEEALVRIQAQRISAHAGEIHALAIEDQLQQMVDQQLIAVSVICGGAKQRERLCRSHLGAMNRDQRILLDDYLHDLLVEYFAQGRSISELRSDCAVQVVGWVTHGGSRHAQGSL